MAAATSSSGRHVRDYYGRRYRIGDDAAALTGHSRLWQSWSAWVCMAAISQLQYGFSVLALGLGESRTWGASQTMWLFALFVAIQAAVTIPVSYLHREGHATPSRLVVTGGALSAVALVTLAHADGFVAALIGYSLAGGVGAGLVYSTAISVAAQWFPDRRVSTIGFVTGGFAIGAVPSIALLTLVSSSHGQTVVLDFAAVVTVALVTVGGSRLRDSPPQWWPPDIDAQLWAVDHTLNPSLPHNIPATRSYTPAEAMRTGVLPLMWLILALISAVSLFAVAFVVGFAVDAGLGVGLAGLSAGLLAAVNGLARSFAGRLSDRFGRRDVLAAVLAVEGLAQLGLAAAGGAGSPWAFAGCAMLAGIGGGAFYSILGNVVLEYFGENSVLQNQSVLYTAKAVGGLAGVGGGAALTVALGYGQVFVGAGVVGVVTAVLVRFLRPPRKAVPAETGRPA